MGETAQGAARGRDRADGDVLDDSMPGETADRLPGARSGALGTLLWGPALAWRRLTFCRRYQATWGCRSSARSGRRTPQSVTTRGASGWLTCAASRLSTVSWVPPPSSMGRSATHPAISVVCRIKHPPFVHRGGRAGERGRWQTRSRGLLAIMLASALVPRARRRGRRPRCLGLVQRVVAERQV